MGNVDSQPWPSPVAPKPTKKEASKPEATEAE